MVLKKEQIVHQALELLNRGGLQRLTIRKLAEALGVQPGALYWHFKNKQALLDAMAEAILQELGTETGQSVGRWDELLKNEMIKLRTALLCYRDGAAVVLATKPKNIQAYDRFSKVLIQNLGEAGFTSAQAISVGGNALIYTVGLTFMERSPINSGDKREKGAASPDMQTFFEEGLELFIKGAAQDLSESL